jgi:hypothetical protein
LIWHVYFRDNDGLQVRDFPTPEMAIDAACGLISSGREVTGIGDGPLSDCIAGADIATLYAFWRETRL